MRAMHVIAKYLTVEFIDGRALAFVDARYREKGGPRPGEPFHRYLIMHDRGYQYRPTRGAGLDGVHISRRLAKLLVLHAFPEHQEFIAGIDWGKWGRHK